MLRRSARALGDLSTLRALAMCQYLLVMGVAQAGHAHAYCNEHVGAPPYCGGSGGLYHGRRGSQLVVELIGHCPASCSSPSPLAGAKSRPRCPKRLGVARAVAAVRQWPPAVQPHWQSAMQHDDAIRSVTNQIGYALFLQLQISSPSCWLHAFSRVRAPFDRGLPRHRAFLGQRRRVGPIALRTARHSPAFPWAAVGVTGGRLPL